MSKDRKMIVDTTSVESIYVDDKCIKAYESTMCNFEVLGKYENEEKAKEAFIRAFSRISAGQQVIFLE
ncbi:MAG: hypothetical protein Q4F05_11395 [bacterium]|nr:hypothetical protein [bacterium]